MCHSFSVWCSCPPASSDIDGLSASLSLPHATSPHANIFYVRLLWQAFLVFHKASLFISIVSSDVRNCSRQLATDAIAAANTTVHRHVLRHAASHSYLLQQFACVCKLFKTCHACRGTVCTTFNQQLPAIFCSSKFF